MTDRIDPVSPILKSLVEKARRSESKLSGQVKFNDAQMGINGQNKFIIDQLLVRMERLEIKIRDQSSMIEHLKNIIDPPPKPPPTEEEIREAAERLLLDAPTRGQLMSARAKKRKK